MVLDTVRSVIYNITFMNYHQTLVQIWQLLLPFLSR